MFKLIVLLYYIVCVVFFIGVEAPLEKNDCPEIANCRCDKARARAQCTNVNKIPEVPPEIQILDLTNNQITDIKRTNFKHKNFTQLSFRYNDITQIENDAFSDLSELTELDLSFNELRTLYGQLLRNNTKLKRLDLNSNKALICPLCEFPKTLEYLNVGNTNIMLTYTNILVNMTNLHTYNGYFCLKDHCVHPLQFDVELKRDNNLNNGTEYEGNEINTESTIDNNFNNVMDYEENEVNVEPKRDNNLNTVTKYERNEFNTESNKDNFNTAKKSEDDKVIAESKRDHNCNNAMKSEGNDCTYYENWVIALSIALAIHMILLLIIGFWMFYFKKDQPRDDFEISERQALAN